MPSILDRLVEQLKAKGVGNPEAIAITHLQKHGILTPGGSELTRKGEKRDAMTPAERCIDRACAGTKHHKTDYVYDPKTNSARLKKRG